MKIFITGLPGSGKSTVLIKVLDFLKSKNLSVGGIISPEIKEKGRRIGFEVVDIFSNKRKVFASIYFKSNYKVSKYFVDINAFEEVATNALEFAFENCDVIAIDEIGKMELLSKKFEEIVYKIVHSNKPLIAVVHRNYIDDFREFGKTFVVTQENRDELLKAILNYIIQNLGIKT